jgi:ABC-type lipoprotein export system ATPase subunit
LLSTDKIVVMATHDPVLALAADHRIIFEHGAVSATLQRTEHEALWLSRLEAMEGEWSQVRAALRRGRTLPPLA